MVSERVRLWLSTTDRVRLARSGVCARVIDFLESQVPEYDYTRDGPRIVADELVVAHVAYAVTIDTLRVASRDALRASGSAGIPTATLLARLLEEMQQAARAADWVA